MDYKAGFLLKTLCCHLSSLVVCRQQFCQHWYLQWIELGLKAAEERQLLWQTYLNDPKSSWKDTGILMSIEYWTGSSCGTESNEVLHSSICPLHIIGSQLISFNFQMAFLSNVSFSKRAWQSSNSKVFGERNTILCSLLSFADWKGRSHSFRGSTLVKHK